MSDEEAIGVILRDYSDVEAYESLKIDLSKTPIKDRALSILKFLKMGSHNYEKIISIKESTDKKHLNWIVKEAESEGTTSFTTPIKNYPST